MRAHPPARPAALLARSVALVAAALVLSGCLAVVPVTIPIGNGAPAMVPAGPAPAMSRCTRPEGAAAETAAVIEGVNRLRTRAGLAPLRPDARLAAAARAQACENAARGVASHRGSDGSTLPQRLSREGVRLRHGGEVVALGQRGAARALEGWAGSPAHRDILLDPDVGRIGAGLAGPPGPGRAWVVVVAAPG
jgi:uncharacterized protein YkwD